MTRSQPLFICCMQLHTVGSKPLTKRSLRPSFGLEKEGATRRYRCAEYKIRKHHAQAEARFCNGASSHTEIVSPSCLVAGGHALSWGWAKRISQVSSTFSARNSRRLQTQRGAPISSQRYHGPWKIIISIKGGSKVSVASALVHCLLQVVTRRYRSSWRAQGHRNLRVR